MIDSRGIIEQLRQGDEVAFASLIRTYQAGLLRTAKAIVSNQIDAEEVLQETWLAVWRGIQKFEGRSSLKTWIYQILIYRAKNWQYHKRRYISLTHVSYSLREWQSMSMLKKNPSATVSPQKAVRSLPVLCWDERTPERLCLSREIRTQINQALNTLPPVQKRVFLLHHFEHLETMEIRQILNLSANNQRIILYRARQAMRQMLKTFYTD